MKPSRRLMPIALAAALAGMALGDGGSAAVESPRAQVQAALRDVARKPRDFLGQELRAVLQVESQPAEWNPYLTRFGTEDYRAVIAWGDEQNLWERADYDSPAAMLFVRRGGAAEAALLQAERYSRFEATGIVRQVLLARPWIEITALKPLAEQWSAGSMIHAARGVELMAAEHWELASQSFERALASELPARARLELERLRGECAARAPRPIEIPRKKNGLRADPRASK